MRILTNQELKERKKMLQNLLAITPTSEPAYTVIRSRIYRIGSIIYFNDIPASKKKKILDK